MQRMIEDDTETVDAKYWNVTEVSTQSAIDTLLNTISTVEQESGNFSYAFKTFSPLSDLFTYVDPNIFQGFTLSSAVIIPVTSNPNTPEDQATLCDQGAIFTQFPNYQVWLYLIINIFIFIFFCVFVILCENVYK